MTSFKGKYPDHNRLVQPPPESINLQKGRTAFMNRIGNPPVLQQPDEKLWNAPKGAGATALIVSTASALYDRMMSRVELAEVAIYLDRAGEVPKGEIGFVCMSGLELNLSLDWEKGFMDPKYRHVEVISESARMQVLSRHDEKCHYVDNRVSIVMQESMCPKADVEQRSLNLMEVARTGSLGSLEMEKWRQWLRDPATIDSVDRMLEAKDRSMYIEPEEMR